MLFFIKNVLFKFQCKEDKDCCGHLTCRESGKYVADPLHELLPSRICFDNMSEDEFMQNEQTLIPNKPSKVLFVKNETNEVDTKQKNEIEKTFDSVKQSKLINENSESNDNEEDVTDSQPDKIKKLLKSKTGSSILKNHIAQDPNDGSEDNLKAEDAHTISDK